jgi:hypothetical protein
MGIRFAPSQLRATTVRGFAGFQLSSSDLAPFHRGNYPPVLLQISGNGVNSG